MSFTKQLEDKQDSSLQEQINAQSWLGRCYLEQAMKAEGESAVKLFDQAVKHYQQQLSLAKQLGGKTVFRNRSMPDLG